MIPIENIKINQRWLINYGTYRKVVFLVEIVTVTPFGRQVVCKVLQNIEGNDYSVGSSYTFAFDAWTYTLLEGQDKAA